MVLFRKLLSLSFLNLSLKKRLVLHHHFGANIRESESHWEEQISSRRLFERWAERARGRRRWRERGRAEFRGVLERWTQRLQRLGSPHTHVLLRERLGPRAFRPPAPSQ